MRRLHFEALRPLCPVCQAGVGSEFPLEIAAVSREDDKCIIEGILHCPNPSCLREYPIVDGIPLIITGLRTYLADNVLHVYGRNDLSDSMESILGDCCGPGSTFDNGRQQLSSYGWDHYGDLDPQELPSNPPPGCVLQNLREGLRIAGDIPSGPIIDVGCSVGRTSFALAERRNDLVLGVDLNYPMLRMASNVLRHGIVTYPRRHVGLVYERREFPVRFKNTANVDFWACDATALPFRKRSFAAAVALNVLDCVQAPTQLLESLARVLTLSGKALLTCPYDWSVTATPLEAWLGGHSQRSKDGGASEPLLRALLTPRAHPNSIPGLEVFAESDSLEWQVRLHERSTMSYRVHLVVARSTDVAEAVVGNKD